MMKRDELEARKAALLASISALRTEAPGEALGQALRDLGEAERKLGNREAACAHYEESVSILRTWGGPLRLAHTVRHLGDVYRETGEPNRARVCYDEALAIYRSHPEAAALDVANAVRSTAVLEYELGNRDAAHQLWKEVRTSYLALGIDAGVAECDRRLQDLRAGGEPQ